MANKIYASDAEGFSDLILTSIGMVSLSGWKTSPFGSSDAGSLSSNWGYFICSITFFIKQFKQKLF